MTVLPVEVTVYFQSGGFRHAIKLYFAFCTHDFTQPRKWCMKIQMHAAEYQRIKILCTAVFISYQVGKG